MYATIERKYEYELNLNFKKPVKIIYYDVLCRITHKSGILNAFTDTKIDIKGTIIARDKIKKIEPIEDSKLNFFVSSKEIPSPLDKRDNTIYFNSRTGQFSNSPQENEKKHKKKKRK